MLRCLCGIGWGASEWFRTCLTGNKLVYDNAMGNLWTSAWWKLIPQPDLTDMLVSMIGWGKLQSTL